MTTSSLATLRRAVDRLLEAILALLLSAMTLAVLWQVASRYLLGDPSSVTEELARFLLIWLGLLGAAYAFGQKAHVALPGLLRVMERRAGSRTAVLSRRLAHWLPVLAVAAFSLGVLLVGGARLVSLVLDLEQRSAALGMPLGWVYLVLPLAGLLILLYCLCDAVEPRPGAHARRHLDPHSDAEIGDRSA
ncbi:MAG TPA: TRAP transporter small permease [Thermoanaerobaculia bacterium]|nr:TRAP transporter small permease [Thermoanaerobaculia bacterium]